ncbi:MAG: acyl-CoA dehydrogenase family protein [Myxococcaceae bacterium]|nr:acyl-CoA dehydrogenase family protein [Myxococcaceae bacterium]
MPNYFHDNDDLKFYFDEYLDWDALVRVTEFLHRSPDGFKSAAEAKPVYRALAETVGEFVANEVAPRAAVIDREGVHLEHGAVKTPRALDEVFEKIKELGLHGLNLPRELGVGGLNAPMTLYFINCELFARADVSVMAHHSFHGGIAMAMLLYSVIEGTTEIDPATARIVKTRWLNEIRELAAGEAWGSMDITEPDAGSDMAALRTVGEQDAQGNWFVTGQKIFLTSGHGKYHFVIARTEKAVVSDDPMAGLKGLSMFLVRADASSLDRVEEKLGHHGSVTAARTFEKAPAELVGKRGEGFKYMLKLMNNARLGVGFECLGLSEAALRLAKAYAAERKSMGKTIDRHELVADMLDEMETDLQGLRALAMYGSVENELAEKKNLAQHFLKAEETELKAQLTRESKRHATRTRRVTPLLKYLAAEKAVEIARRALQLHGGNGYMQDYGAEKLLRDALVMPIYEGTSQIQSLMAMKDTLGGIIGNPQGFLRRLAQANWRSVSARDGLEKRVAKLQALSLAVQQQLVTRTAGDKFKSLKGVPLAQWPTAFLKDWNPKRDFAFAMLHAERLTRILADEAICEELLRQAQRFPKRRELLERYLERAEPRCRFLADEIATTGDRLLSTLKSREPTARASA